MPRLDKRLKFVDEGIAREATPALFVIASYATARDSECILGGETKLGPGLVFASVFLPIDWDCSFRTLHDVDVGG